MANRFPTWIRRSWASPEDLGCVRRLLDELGLSTVCQEARCPNLGECWRRGTATVMILGNLCTRNCSYCAVSCGEPSPVNPREPQRVAEAIRRLALRHAVITSVTRDDLPDGGASHFAQTVRAVRAACPDTTVEVLVPDFRGDPAALRMVLDSGPDVFGHNIETVARLYPEVRDSRCSYCRSLKVLKTAADHSLRLIVKSGFMLGHGETPEEVRETLEDLLEVGCAAVCIGQYLQPSRDHRNVVEFVSPEEFKAYEEMAYSLGFRHAVAGPFVRSSYLADRVVSAGFAGRERLTALERA